jgi:hypothetical protein
MLIKFQPLHPNHQETMLLNSRRFHEGKKINLAIDHQSLEILLLLHMLSKLNLLYFIKKLTIKRLCLSNYILCTQISKKLYHQTREGLWNSFKISSSQHYLTHIYSFKLLQTSNPLSLVPPSTKIHHLSPPLPKKNDTRRRPPKNSSSPSFSSPLLELVIFVQWRLWKSFLPIHGLLILQEPIRVENDLPSNKI